MDSYILAFLFGLCIPVFASRYAKIYASDLGEFLFFMWHKPHFPKTSDDKRAALLKRKWYKFIAWSIFWAIVLTGAFICTDYIIPAKAIPWFKIFICLVTLLAVTDHQFYVLPDIVTVPLIFLGFGYALWGGIITPETSFLGACYGYLIPAICVLLTSAFFPNSFGGGDVKMLAGLGCWMGPFALALVILISALTFILTSFITKKRSDAYGPHLAISGILMLLFSIFHVISFL